MSGFQVSRGRVMAVFKSKRKNQSEEEGIGGEGEPDADPVFYTVAGEMVDDPAAAHRRGRRRPHWS